MFKVEIEENNFFIDEKVNWGQFEEKEEDVVSYL
jgi:hypothetical protein